MSPRMALFAYGSLVSRRSAAATLGRPVGAPIPARLRGWRRRWSQVRDNLAVEKRFARRDGSRPRHILGLNIEPSDERAEVPNGGLVEVTEAELRRLDLREIRYDRVEIAPSHGFDRVFAYRAKPAHRATGVPPDAVVIAAYAAQVESAFAELGDGELELYRGSTGPPPVEVIDAVLVRDRIPEGNPRNW